MVSLMFLLYFYTFRARPWSPPQRGPKRAFFRGICDWGQKGVWKGHFFEEFAIGAKLQREWRISHRFRQKSALDFSLWFLSHSYRNFSILGLGRGPPQKGSWKEHFSEEFSIGAKLLQNHVNFSHFLADSGEGESQTGQPQNQSKIRGKQSKA